MSNKINICVNCKWHVSPVHACSHPSLLDPVDGDYSDCRMNRQQEEPETDMEWCGPQGLLYEEADQTGQPTGQLPLTGVASPPDLLY